MARLQSRPLAEHVWRDGGWYHTVTGKPFNEEVYIAGVRRRQAECEWRRYWDDASGTRKRRLMGSMRDAANRPRKRRAAMQLTLESVPRSAAEVASHPRAEPGCIWGLLQLEHNQRPQLLYTEEDRELMEEAWAMTAAHREDLVSRSVVPVARAALPAPASPAVPRVLAMLRG